MFCSKCGTQNDEGSLYCSSCGAQLEQPEGVANPNPTPESAPTPAPEPVQNPASESAPNEAPESVQESTPDPVPNPAADPVQNTTPDPAQNVAPDPVPNPAQNPMPNAVPNQNQQFYQQPMQQPVQQPSPGGEAFMCSFRALKDIFKKPISVAQNLVEPNGIISGIVYMGIKCLVLLILVLIESKGNDVGTVVVYILLTTFGLNCLEAALIRGFSIAFKLDINMKQAFTSVGVASWFSALIWIVIDLFGHINDELGLILLIITIPIPCILTLASICHMSKGDTNKKAYMYIIVRVICLLVFAIITHLTIKSSMHGFSSLFSYRNFF